METSVERWWKDTDGGEVKVLGKKHLPFTQCMPQISHEISTKTNLNYI